MVKEHRVHDHEWAAGYTMEGRDNITVGYELGGAYLMRLNVVRIPGKVEPIPFKVIVEGDDAPNPLVRIFQGVQMVASFNKPGVGILESYDYNPGSFGEVPIFEDRAPDELYS